LRCFCTHNEKAFLSSKLWIPDWEFFGREQKCHDSSTLNELRRAHGGKAIPISENLARKLPQKWLVTGGGGAIEAVLTWSVQSGKTWL
jgi:hypothetical protein